MTARRAAGPRRASAAGRAAQVQQAARRLGIEKLHPEQEQGISGVLDGRDVLMVLPTGFGKSAVYQVPSMVLPRPVVLISPLLALLRDQHEKLRARDVPVVRLDGTVRGPARRAALARIAEGGPLLVMTTPETAAGGELAGALAGSGVGLAAVDEAHCISEWGHDFRPSYLRVGARLRELGAPSVLALTATATPRVREGIVRSLGMREPLVVAASPHRSNLAFEVLVAEGDLRPRALIRLVKRLRRPGIVYCATTREVDQIYALLMRFKVPALRYHGRMTATERNTAQEQFMRPRRRPVMVATSAFGLGIDKRDIRYVLHYQSPASLEQYVQEAGRAGRDGRRANGILLYDPADRAIHEALLARSRVRPEQLFRLGHALAAWADEDREPSLEALSLSAEMGPRVAAALLAKVEEAGLAERDDDRVRVQVEADRVATEVRSLAGQFETLRTEDARRLDKVSEYSHTRECRAAFLRGYFGEETGEPCGLCDVCQGRPARPEEFFEPLASPEPLSRRKRPGRRGERREPGRGGRKRGGRTARPTRKRSEKHGGKRSARRRGGGRGAVGDEEAPRTGDTDSEKPQRPRKARSRRRRRRPGSRSEASPGPGEAPDADPTRPKRRRGGRRRRRGRGRRADGGGSSPDRPSGEGPPTGRGA